MLPRVVMIENSPRIIFIAKRDIKSGEEITYDYGDRTKSAIFGNPWLRK